MRSLKFFQYAYIAFAVLFTYEAFVNWGVDQDKAYMSIFFVALAIFMFFFRRRFRKKIEDRHKQ